MLSIARKARSQKAGRLLAHSVLQENILSTLILFVFLAMQASIQILQVERKVQIALLVNLEHLALAEA